MSNYNKMKVSKSYRKKFNAIVKFIMENNLHKTMYKSRRQDCIDKLREQTDEPQS